MGRNIADCCALDVCQRELRGDADGSLVVGEEFVTGLGDDLGNGAEQATGRTIGASRVSSKDWMNLGMFHVDWRRRWRS